jgi:hypothetical protein
MPIERLIRVAFVSAVLGNWSAVVAKRRVADDRVLVDQCSKI